MRKIINYQVVFVLVILGMLFSCATVQNDVPAWILSPTSVYSDSEYLSAVGYGSDRVSAENAAISAITKIVKQNVKSTTTSTESFLQTSKGWDTTKDLTNNVETYTDLVISGIYIQDVYPVKNGKTVEYYALALVNRKEAGNHYKSKIKELTSVINEKIVDAYKNMGTFAAYATLSEAATLAKENDYYLDILAVINPDFYKVSIPEYGNAANIEELARRCLSQIVIGFEINGDIDGRIEAAFSKIFAEYGIKLSKITDEDATYTLIADVSFSPLNITSESKNKYIRFVVNANLSELSSAKIVLPFAISGREAHLSEEEATQRAIRTIENEIRKQFQTKVDNLF